MLAGARAIRTPARALLQAEVIAFEGLREAQAELIELEADVAAVKGWLPLVWRLDARRRERVARRMPAVRAARQRVADLQRQLDQKMREAKAALGLWSEVGVEESKALFWRSFASGKLFAQRQSFWDAVFTITLANFTTGMLIAVFAFLFQLPSLLASYGAPLWKALPFFAVASAGAISVAASYLGLLYGAGFGVAYGTVAVVAQRRQALLEGQAAERRRLAYEGHHHGD
eukprot:scaffold3.g6331.t1